MKTSELKKELSDIFDTKNSVSQKLQAICDLLRQEKTYYDWVGFYFQNGDKKELKLAEFSGELGNSRTKCLLHFF